MNENVRQSVLMEAEGVVNGPRREAYGHPKLNFARIIALWQSYLDGRPGGRMADLTEQDHAVMMILLKVARLQQSPQHRDSAVDIAGYTATIERLWEEES